MEELSKPHVIHCRPVLQMLQGYHTRLRKRAEAAREHHAKVIARDLLPHEFGQYLFTKQRVRVMLPLSHTERNYAQCKLHSPSLGTWSPVSGPGELLSFLQAVSIMHQARAIRRRAPAIRCRAPASGAKQAGGSVACGCERAQRACHRCCARSRSLAYAFGAPRPSDLPRFEFGEADVRDSFRHVQPAIPAAHGAQAAIHQSAHAHADPHSRTGLARAQTWRIRGQWPRQRWHGRRRACSHNA